MHLFAAGAPSTLTDDDRRRYAAFFNAMASVLPCQKCSQHFAAILVESPIHAGSREELEMWLIDVHNRVRRELGQEEMARDVARAHWAAIAEGRKALGGGGGDIVINDNGVKKKVAIAGIVLVGVALVAILVFRRGSRTPRCR
jgi:hypothetical protein